MFLNTEDALVTPSILTRKGREKRTGNSLFFQVLQDLGQNFPP